MKIALGADHGGYVLKGVIARQLADMGHTVVDCGATSLDPTDDYPDFARSVGEAIQHGQAERAVLICGSGVGASIAATKMRGVRASICHDTYSAHQGVEHDDMNVLCLGARVVGEALAKELVQAFVSAQYIGSGRYKRRLDKVLEIERASTQGNK